MVEEEPDPIEMVSSDWFEIASIADRTYALEEPKSSQYNVSYLILGDNQALMFDSGSGENQAINNSKIKHIIDQLTPLPVSILLSHFHFDHNQNIAEFNTVAFQDLPFLRQSVDANNIYHFTPEDLFSGTNPSQVQVDRWLPINEDIDLV